MSLNEIPIKPRRKKLDVPIHKVRIEDEIAHKTFSANFNSKRGNKQKFQHEEEMEKKSPKNRQIIPKIVVEPNEYDRITQKVSRKYLTKENARLVKENEEIRGKFNELEELSVKKITKLKEKIAVLETNNREVVQENCYVKNQFDELLIGYESLKTEFELKKNCQSCVEFKQSLEEVLNENNLLKTSKKEIEEDLNMLKTVVFRLNLQIERYQEKLRKHNIKITKNHHLTTTTQTLDNISSNSDQNMISHNILSELHHNHPHTPITWGKVNVHTLGPLLDAYQDTINEKDEIILNYETEISNFTGKLKEILNENEKLYKELNEDSECSSKLKLDLDNLKRELKMVKEQNDMLIKKCAVKQDKIEEILKCYETKVEQLKRDYAVVHEQYYNSRTEIASLKEKNKSLHDSQEDFRSERQNYIPLSVHTSSVNECRKWYEELKLQYEQEKTKLKETTDNQTKIINELNNTITNQSREREEIENKVKQLEKHIKKGETKYLELEHTLNEVQVSRSACRKQLNKAMNFSKDLVTEQETLLKTLNHRQQENKAVKKIGYDIATRMDSLKNQLKNVQRDAWQELTTVEKRMEEQNDLIQTMKLEHNEEVERLQQIIKEQEGNNLLLQGQASLPNPHYLLFRDKHK